jgi:hypothetical protein
MSGVTGPTAVASSSHHHHAQQSQQQQGLGPGGGGGGGGSNSSQQNQNAHPRYAARSTSQPDFNKVTNVAQAKALANNGNAGGSRQTDMASDKDSNLFHPNSLINGMLHVHNTTQQVRQAALQSKPNSKTNSAANSDDEGEDDQKLDYNNNNGVITHRHSTTTNTSIYGKSTNNHSTSALSTQQSSTSNHNLNTNGGTAAAAAGSTPTARAVVAAVGSEGNEYGGTVLINKLHNGGIFLKHGTRGTPHYRFVWCDSELARVCWGELNSKKLHGSIDVKSIIDIKQGHQTKTFQRAPKTCLANRCFSIISAARTLDLEAISEQERGLWVLTFHFLLECGKKQAQASKLLSSSLNSVHSRVTPVPSPHPSANISSASASASVSATNPLIAAAVSSTANVNPAAAALAAMTSGTNSMSSSAMGLHAHQLSLSLASPSDVDSPSQAEIKLRADLDTAAKKLREAALQVAQLQRAVDKWEEENRKLLIDSARYKIEAQGFKEDLFRVRAENRRLREQAKHKRRGSI